VNLAEGVREVLGITFLPVDNLVSGFSGPVSTPAKVRQRIVCAPSSDSKCPGFPAHKDSEVDPV